LLSQFILALTLFNIYGLSTLVILTFNYLFTMPTSTNKTLYTNETLKQILDTVNELKSTQNKIIASINSCRESNETQEKSMLLLSRN